MSSGNDTSHNDTTHVIPDASWAEYARAARDALARLGYGLAPRCLPGEDEECGATYAQHTVAYLAAINAVCDHQLAHLGPAYSEVEVRIYLYESAALEERCEDGHRPGPLPAG